MLRALGETSEPVSVEGDPLVEALEKLRRVAPTGSLMFVVGDLNRDPGPLHQALGQLCQKHELVLMPVDDPADREIPRIGRVVFSTRDGNRIEVDTDSEAGRRHYREVWEANRRALETLARRLGIAFIPVPTNEEVQGVLVAGLRRRAARQGRR